MSAAEGHRRHNALTHSSQHPPCTFFTTHALHSLPSLPPLDIPQDTRLLPLKVLLVNQILAQKLLELLQPLPPPS